jgi:hypothetical protein
MIDLLLKHGLDPALERDLLRSIAAHVAAVRASAGRGDVGQVGAAEAVVRSNPTAAFSFAPSGAATLTVGDRAWDAGTFEVFSIRTLRQRAAAKREGQARLWVLDGISPATDIGALQAHADSDTTFQVASQFNCLEAAAPRVTAVKNYLSDPTQGPRAAISAFPATLLRHYAAPGADGGRFVQTHDGRQIELLAQVCGGFARVENGYLMAQNVSAPERLLSILEARFDDICVGVHDGVEVVLGYDWAGAVPGPPSPRITQVFTSTMAAAHYGQLSAIHEELCRHLLRAAYLGTLLAARACGRRRVVLTLIGGGAFGNPMPLIWDSILWAIDQLEAGDMDIIVNGRDLTTRLPHEKIVATTSARGGLLLTFLPSGAATLHR